MKNLCWLMLFFGFLNTAVAQDVTGTWHNPGIYKAEWFQDGQNVYSIYNVGNFKHYLAGRFISTNQIEAQVVRIDVNTNCRTVLTFRYTLNGNTLTGLWTANDSNCDLQPGPTSSEVITRTTASPRPMNPFGGTAFNPATDVTGSWSWEDDWLQDNRNVYYIANGNGFKQFFKGIRRGNQITGQLIRYNPSGCRMILNQTFTQTNANTMQYTWVAVGNCDVTNGQRGEGTITRKAPGITITETRFQTETQIKFCISNAAPNSVVFFEATVPVTETYGGQLTTDSDGNLCHTLYYPLTRSWCLLTNAFRRTPGKIIVKNQAGQIIATKDFDISNLFNRPVGGVNSCPNTFGVTIKTGGDDLRGGSSKAFIKFHFRNGNMSPEFALNDGANWRGGSYETRVFEVGDNNPDDLAAVTIRHDGTPNNNPFNGGNLTDTYDNWNMDGIKIDFNYGVVLMNLNGSPLVRFDGNVRTRRFAR